MSKIPRGKYVRIFMFSILLIILPLIFLVKNSTFNGYAKVAMYISFIVSFTILTLLIDFTLERINLNMPEN